MMCFVLYLSWLSVCPADGCEGQHRLLPLPHVLQGEEAGAVTGRKLSSEPSEIPHVTGGKGFSLGVNDTKPCVGFTRVGGNLNNQSLCADS